MYLFLQMVYSMYLEQRILYYHLQGYRAYTIAILLKEKEKLPASRQGIHEFLRRYRDTGSIGRTPSSGRLSRITAAVMQLVEAQMQKDDETTAVQLHAFLNNNNIDLSLKTILRCRTQLGWTFRGSAYCQLIRTANKEKRLIWAKEVLNHDFKDVIWTDESSIQMESHRRHCCRKIGQRPHSKPRSVCLHTINFDCTLTIIL